MYIDLSNSSQLPKLEDVIVGQVFMTGGNYYMRGPSRHSQIQCMRLSNGYIQDLDPERRVNLYERAKVVLNP